MIQVIGTKENTLYCNCGACLLFEKKDLMYTGEYFLIRCPVCGELMMLDYEVKPSKNTVVTAETEAEEQCKK